MLQVADVYCISCSARLGWTYLKVPLFRHVPALIDSPLTYMSRPSNPLRNTKKASPIRPRLPRLIIGAVLAGKYLLEQERIFKDNAWELQEASVSN